jgi:dihydrofolate synthase / folylpolyglutamate synthase
MSQITTLAEAQVALEPYWPHHTKHRRSLTFMAELMDYLGNPQNRLRIIHVAGTSGKTSTAYYCAALLRASGKKVGLTISPHVDTVNERVQINLAPLSERQFCAELTAFLALLQKGGFEPTYFELLHAFAFWIFARLQVEYAVVEVGVGGLLDSTNVISREDKICVLTDIGLDHTQILGDTIPQIAAQKAGIITLHNAVFCYRQSNEVMDVFTEAARQKQAQLYMLSRVPVHPEADDLPLFQRRNYGLAYAAVHYICQRDHLPAPAAEALHLAAHTHIPGRMELLRLRNKTLILDASHNAQKLHALAESIRQQFPRRPVAVLAALIAGRVGRMEAAAKELSELADYLIVSSFSGGRDGPVHSLDPEVIAKACEKDGATSVDVIADPEAAFARLQKRPEKVLVVTGSFYLLNHIRPLVQKQPSED